MATCKMTPKDFIKNSFLPQIAVACSQTATQICQKNNLTFTELLQPFCKLASEVTYKDVSGTSISLKNLKISLVDVNSRPPQPTLARKLLNLSVSEAPEPRSQKFTFQNYSLDIPASTPWFESWRDTFFQVQFPSDHEFTKHYLSCMFVISAYDKDPLQVIMQLMQSVMQVHNTNPIKMPKWFNKDVLFYYIMLYENINEDSSSAVESFEKVKITYGSMNCFLLRMNSRPPGKVEQLPDPWSRYIVNRFVNVTTTETVLTPTMDISPSNIVTFLDSTESSKKDGNTLEYHPLSPDRPPDEDLATSEQIMENQKSVLHGACLTTEDVEQIKLLVHEFCTRALMPYVEKQINILSDFVTNKKGVSRSLLSATKRWFTSKPGVAAASTLLYSPDSPELQTRRLGDLCFMFGNYHLAYEAYHSAKRDFITDQAWLYYAGALEMASLSAFMGNGSTKKTCDYMEESIITYLNTCKMPQFATRATLLSSECLKSQQSYGEAAHQLIRMTSEESDLRSAILLEQAAYCFLFSKPSMIRKYAFHMVLSGHRYSKASQRKHSLKCYRQAFQIYQDKGWNLAEDHIYYTIGRQANSLNHLDEAVESYSHLLIGNSKQCAEQQALFLKEYLSTFSALLRQQNIFLAQILPLPLLLTKFTKVMLGITSALKMPGRIPALDQEINVQQDSAKQHRWAKLEELLVQEAQGTLPMIFKPLKTVFLLKEVTTATPVGIVGERINVLLQLENKFLIHLYLKNIHLLWQFTDSKNIITSNEIKEMDTDNSIKISNIDVIVLNPNSTQEICLSLIPLVVGEVVLKGISYSLYGADNFGEKEVYVKGKQIFEVNSKSSTNSLSEKPFKISIVPEAPCLQVTFSEILSELLRNEIQKISVEITNVGTDSLQNIFIATSRPDLLSSCDFKNHDSSTENDTENLASKDKLARKHHISDLQLPNGKLQPSQSYTFNIWLQAPDEVGLASIDLLIYYENVRENSIPRYRLVKHEWNLHIRESVKIDVQTSLSVLPDGSSNNLILSTRITNLNQFCNERIVLITPTNAALISSAWSLHTDIVIPENIKIQCQESVNILMKAFKIRKNNDRYSQVFFEGNKFMDSFATALQDFAYRDKHNEINIFDDPDHVHHMLKPDTVLVLRWHGVISDGKGNKRSFYGQSKIALNIKEGESLIANINEKLLLQETKFDFEFQNLVKKDDLVNSTNHQIKCNIQHPPLVKADFSINKIHLVPVKLLLHNLIEITSVVTVKAVQGRRSMMLLSNPSMQFCWVSKNMIEKTIGPLGMEVVDFTLAVVAPGTYDLSAHMEVWCSNENQGTGILQLCRNTSALIVVNSVM